MQCFEISVGRQMPQMPPPLVARLPPTVDGSHDFLLFLMFCQNFLGDLSCKAATMASALFFSVDFRQTLNILWYGTRHWSQTLCLLPIYSAFPRTSTVRIVYMAVPSSGGSAFTVAPSSGQPWCTFLSTLTQSASVVNLQDQIYNTFQPFQNTCIPIFHICTKGPTFTTWKAFFWI